MSAGRPKIIFIDGEEWVPTMVRLRKAFKDEAIRLGINLSQTFERTLEEIVANDPMNRMKQLEKEILDEENKISTLKQARIQLQKRLDEENKVLREKNIEQLIDGFFLLERLLKDELVVGNGKLIRRMNYLNSVTNSGSFSTREDMARFELDILEGRLTKQSDVHMFLAYNFTLKHESIRSRIRVSLIHMAEEEKGIFARRT